MAFVVARNIEDNADKLREYPGYTHAIHRIQPRVIELNLDHFGRLSSCRCPNLVAPLASLRSIRTTDI